VGLAFNLSRSDRGVPIGLGDKVGSMGLVLESVEPKKLIFSDSGGKKYPKSY